MNYEIGDEITLEDDKSYLVVDVFDFKENKYLYLINEESRKASLVKILDDTIYEIKDDNEFNLVLNELVNRNNNKINEILKGTNE